MQQYRGFVEQYMAELRELTVNSKPIITNLTILAEENKGAASSIVAAIERHISTCPVTSKLPGLYLLDSIAKNVKHPFVALFARNLPEVFHTVWIALPSAHQQLGKLLNTWHGIFPHQALTALSSKIQQQAAPPQPGNSSGAHRQQQDLQQPPFRQPLPALFATGPDYAPQPFPNGTGQHGQAPHAQQGVHGPHRQPIMGFPPGASAQPLHSLSGMHAWPSARAQPAVAAHAPHHAPAQPYQSAPYQSAHMVEPISQADNSAAIAALLASLAQGGPLAAPPTPPASAPVPTVPVQLPHKSPSIPTTGALSLEQVKAVLQADCSPVVEKLVEKSVMVRPQHLDQWYLKRRRAQENAKASQHWFVDADTWLLGTTADASAIPDFFAEGWNQTAQDTESLPSEPADDQQPTCGLSGERFETFWDDQLEEWRYRGAKRLIGDEAERYGVSDGTLVKVGCLSGAGAALGIAIPPEHDERGDRETVAAPSTSEQDDSKDEGMASLLNSNDKQNKADVKPDVCLLQQEQTGMHPSVHEGAFRVESQSGGSGRTFGTRLREDAGDMHEPAKKLKVESEG